MDALHIWSFTGPSPRAWGIPGANVRIAFRCRSIHTCVGNTSLYAPRSSRLSVHPHVRGEYQTVSILRAGVDGPSPRAWGIHTREPVQRRGWRSIPTCVGNTRWRGPPRRAPSVHPHVRGEYATGRTALVRGPHGPSPRAWGIPHTLYHRIEMPRSIPTCVGNTRTVVWVGGCPAVHPHVRGEYSIGRVTPLTKEGPSPRAWGILIRPRHYAAPIRSIPTCVGNTRLLSARLIFFSVHPHVRGEYVGLSSVRTSGYGPSPRAWGILRPLVQGVAKGRSIPTCVGNTRTLPGIARHTRVHPHVRGEYFSPCCTSSRSIGPSPRAWGILTRLLCPEVMCRSIPTCVGNTR